MDVRSIFKSKVQNIGLSFKGLVKSFCKYVILPDLASMVLKNALGLKLVHVARGKYTKVTKLM